MNPLILVFTQNYLFSVRLLLKDPEGNEQRFRFPWALETF